MEEKNDDLDNLIIQSSKPSGLRKILLAAAVLLLVLILIILVTKSMIQNEQPAKSSVILPPEPVTQQQTPAKEPLFEQVPIEEERGAKSKQVEQVINRVKESAPKKVVQSAKTAPAEEKVVAETKSEQAETETVKPKATPSPAPRTAPVGTWFIQVGAFFRYPPDKKFLGSIKKEGLNCIIVEGTRNGRAFKKVLIGPYPDRSAAKKDLDRVKKRINQNAYITQKK